MLHEATERDWQDRREASVSTAFVRPRHSFARSIHHVASHASQHRRSTTSTSRLVARVRCGPSFLVHLRPPFTSQIDVVRAPPSSSDVFRSVARTWEQWQQPWRRVDATVWRTRVSTRPVNRLAARTSRRSPPPHPQPDHVPFRTRTTNGFDRKGLKGKPLEEKGPIGPQDPLGFRPIRNGVGGLGDRGPPLRVMDGIRRDRIGMVGGKMPPLDENGRGRGANHPHPVLPTTIGGPFKDSGPCGLSILDPGSRTRLVHTRQPKGGIQQTRTRRCTALRCRA